MRFIRPFILIVATFVLTACNEKPALNGPECDEYNKTSNPVRKAELEKRCPDAVFRSGTFHPSPERHW